MSFISKINSFLKSKGRSYWTIREFYVRSVVFCFSLLGATNKKNSKKRILFYHISSIFYGGTEKNLQIFAKYLNKEKYEVYFMYPRELAETDSGKSRLSYVLDGGVIGIPFDYTKRDLLPPYYVHGMNPQIPALIDALNIDIFFTADAGGASFPFTGIRNIPIFFINIFGVPNLQKNIKYHFCISEAVAEMLDPFVSKRRRIVLPIPLERLRGDVAELGLALRSTLALTNDSVVFGRIGRPDDDIYDPIGILAFEQVVKENPDTHYLIMAPMPVLVRLVEAKKIPNVHFLPQSSHEEDVWAFHGAIDVLAHFRRDGESFGLNIAESMLAGKPIITHRSHIWNAHLEYLDESFSLVASEDNVEQYAAHMRTMIAHKKNGTIIALSKEAKATAEKRFLIENVIKKVEEVL